MAKISNAITIAAPRERVFDVFTDLTRAAERVEGITKLEILENGETFQIGTKWRETRTLFGKEATEDMWVTSLTPPSSYSVEAESRGTHYTSNYRFIEQGQNTLVETDFIGTPLTLGAKIMSLLMFLFARATKKMLQKDLEQLKAACESDV